MNYSIVIKYMYISPVLKDRQRFRILERFEDTKGVIRGVMKGVIRGVIRGVIKEVIRGVIRGVIKGVIKSHKSKDIQYNDQNKKNKQLSTKHYTENKTKGRATRTPLKTEGELRRPTLIYTRYWPRNSWTCSAFWCPID
jgi:hypothetical protein